MLCVLYDTPSTMNLNVEELWIYYPSDSATPRETLSLVSRGNVDEVGNLSKYSPLFVVVDISKKTMHIDRQRERGMNPLSDRVHDKRSDNRVVTRWELERYVEWGHILPLAVT